MENPERSKQYKIRIFRYLAVIMLLAGIFIGFFMLISRSWLKELFLQVKIQQQQSIKQNVYIARNTIEPVMIQFRLGKIGRTDAVNKIRALIRNMTYYDQNGRNYIFMSSYDGTMLVQPFEPAMEMTSQWNLRDTNGLYIIRELVKAARSNPDGAFVNYHYYLPGVHSAQEKMAYVIGLPELECYIGTGIYLQTAIIKQNQILSKVKYGSILLFIIFLIPLSVLIIIIFHRNKLLLLKTESSEIIKNDLRESESRFRSLFDNAPVGVFYSTVDGKIIQVNAEYAKILGFSSPGEIKQVINAADATDFFYSNSHERSLLVNEALKNPGQWIKYQVNDLIAGSKLITVNLAFRVLPENCNILEGFLEDITERKQYETALRENEIKYRRLHQSMMDAFVSVNMAGDIIESNHSFNTMLGYSDDEIYNFNYSDITPEKWHAIENEIVRKQIIPYGFSEVYEKEYIRKDGSIFPVELRTFLIKDDSGRDISMWAIVRDITGRKLSEEKIKNLLSEKELLLKEVHHRIKNNMNSIKGLLTLQLAAEENPAAAESLRSAESRVQSMIILYDKLYCTDKYRELSFKDYIQSLVQDITCSYSDRSNITVKTEIDDLILNVQVLAPLGIVINELITNTMKHAFTGRDSGQINLSASFRNNRAVIMLGDNGIGIPETVSFEKSTGFGLSLVSMLTEQMGGQISIERGAGTKFVIEFDIDG